MEEAPPGPAVKASTEKHSPPPKHLCACHTCAHARMRNKILVGHPTRKDRKQVGQRVELSDTMWSEPTQSPDPILSMSVNKLIG